MQVPPHCKKGMQDDPEFSWAKVRASVCDAYNRGEYASCLLLGRPPMEWLKAHCEDEASPFSADIRMVASLLRQAAVHLAVLHPSGTHRPVRIIGINATHSSDQVLHLLTFVPNTLIDVFYILFNRLAIARLETTTGHGNPDASWDTPECKDLREQLEVNQELDLEARFQTIAAQLYASHQPEEALKWLKECSVLLDQLKSDGKMEDADLAYWRARIHTTRGDIYLERRTSPRVWGHVIWERQDDEYYNREYRPEHEISCGRCRLRCAQMPHVVDKVEEKVRSNSLLQYRAALDILDNTVPQRPDTKVNFCKEQGKCYLRLAFLQLSEAENSAPSVISKLLLDAAGDLVRARQSYEKVNQIECESLAMVQELLVRILLEPPLNFGSEANVKADFQRGQVMQEMAQQVASRVAPIYAAALGHFAAFMGRRWLAMYGIPDIARRCHILAGKIFYGAGATHAFSMSRATLATLCFDFGPDEVCEEAFAQACNALKDNMLLFDQTPEKQKMDRIALITSSELIVRSLYNHTEWHTLPTATTSNLLQRAEKLDVLSPIFRHFIDNARKMTIACWPPAIGASEKETPTPAQQGDEDIDRQIAYFRSQAYGNLKAYIGILDDLPPANEIVPPGLLAFAQDFSTQAEWSAAKKRFQAARNQGDVALKKERKEKLLKIAAAHSDETISLVLQAHCHDHAQEDDIAAVYYLQYTDKLIAWQQERITDINKRRKTLEKSLYEACIWLWRSGRPEAGQRYMNQLCSLPGIESSLTDSWLCKGIRAGILARTGMTEAAHTLYRAVFSDIDKHLQKERNAGYSIAAATNSDISRILFNAAMLWIDNASQQDDIIDPRRMSQLTLSPPSPTSSNIPATVQTANVTHSLSYDDHPSNFEWAFSCLERGRFALQESLRTGVDASPSNGDALSQLCENFHGSPSKLEYILESFRIQRESEKISRRENHIRETTPIRGITTSPLQEPLKSALHTISELQEVMPEQALALLYYSFEGRFVRFTVPHKRYGQARLVLRNIPGYMVRCAMQQLLEYCSIYIREENADLRDQMEEDMAYEQDMLAQVLLGDLEDILTDWDQIRTLYIIRHGVLHNFPFEVLPIKKATELSPGKVIPGKSSTGYKLLLSRFDVRYFTSVQLLEKKLVSRHVFPKIRRTLIIGDPESNLPSAHKEAKKLFELLGGAEHAEILIGAEATVEGVTARLQRAKGRYHCLHYAGHARYNHASPALSGLILAGGHILYAHEITRLPLEGLFVFINACSSAASATTPGQDMVHSIVNAFLQAGAVSAIANLWDVNDDVAIELAAGVYGDQTSRITSALSTAGERERQDDRLVQQRRELAKHFGWHDLNSWAPLAVHGVDVP